MQRSAIASPRKEIGKASSCKQSEQRPRERLFPTGLVAASEASGVLRTAMLARLEQRSEAPAAPLGATAPTAKPPSHPSEQLDETASGFLASAYGVKVGAGVLMHVKSAWSAIRAARSPRSVRSSQTKKRPAILAGLFDELAPRVGFEPTTLRLTAGCSAVELPRNSVRS
jgi:hypothetical protein